MRWLVAVLVLLGGCQAIFELVPPPGPTCTTPSSGFSSFDMPTDAPCDSFGFPNYNPTDPSVDFEVVGGEVRWTPKGDRSGTLGGCIGSVSQQFDAGGIFIETIRPPTGPKEFLEYKGYWDNSGEYTSLARDGSDLAFVHHIENQTAENIDSIPLDASTRWWRQRPRPDGLAVIAEVSADGADWQVFATDERAPPSLIKWELAIGSVAKETDPSTTVIGSINACP